MKHSRSKNAVLLMIIFICSICLNNVWARETGTMDQLEKENPDDVDKMNKVLYYYNTLFFENYTEEELKQQEKFQKSIHLLKELYFEYGSLENIPILPFDPENIREGDSLFTEVVAVINTENNETYFVTENDDMKLLKINTYSMQEHRNHLQHNMIIFFNHLQSLCSASKYLFSSIPRFQLFHQLLILLLSESSLLLPLVLHLIL